MKNERSDSTGLWIGVWLLVIVLVFLVAFMSACPFKKGDSSKGEFIGALPSHTKATTSAGTQIKSKSAVNPQIVTGVEKGLAKALRIAGEPPNNYGPLMGPGQFTVGLWPRSNQCTAAGFLIRADGSVWDGTSFDKDPRPGKVLLCIAGIAAQYANNHEGRIDGSFGMLVVDDVGIIETIVHYESEHEILFAVDVPRWWATIGVHAHPLMGEGESAKGDPQFTAWTYEVEEDMNLAGREVKKGQRFCVILVK